MPYSRDCNVEQSLVENTHIKCQQTRWIKPNKQMGFLSIDSAFQMLEK